MVELEKRPVQTKVKHEILREYLMQWSYIITMGLTGAYFKAQQAGRKLTTRFVYVDCFSFMGIYSPENGQPIYGSPIIGINGLDKLAQNFKERNNSIPETYTILIEENKEKFHVLLQTLEQLGFKERIRETTNFQLLRPGDIAVVNDDHTQHIEQILEFTDRNFTWSFFLLDPFGPKGLPLDVVTQIVSQEHADTIINLMYQDLHKKTGSAAKTQPDPRHIPLLEHWDEMYGGQSWRQIAQSYYGGEIDKENMEKELIELYKNILLNRDRELAVKRIPLKFEDKERTMFYLFLTTHDGTGALKMNEILDDAKISEYNHREKIKSLKIQQSSFFDIVPDPSRPQQAEPDIDEIGTTIYELCKGETITFKTVIARLADTHYYLEHVKKAMTKLKRKEKCSYSELSHKDYITFV